jgi:DNA-binding MarR family transcriptional regulator
VGRKFPSELRYEALLRLLRTANVIWDASRLFFEQWQVSPSQFNVLNLLHANPEGLSQTELGRQLLTHRSNVTGLVDRLEKRGLVERNATPQDRRVFRVLLTSAGEKLLRTLLPHFHTEAEHLWDGVSNQGISELLGALDHVTQNAAKTAGQAANRVNRRQPNERRHRHTS